MNLVEIGRRLIGIDSSPTNGNLETCKFIAELAAKEGFRVDLQEEVFNGHVQANIFLRSPSNDLSQPEVLFLTHLDTADPGIYAHWTQNMGNPYGATIHGDIMYGLGCAGAKMDFLCKMSAAQKHLSSRLSKPFVVCGSFGEQNGMAGAIKLFRRKKSKAKWALVGEPTGFELVNAASGYTEIEIEIPFTDEEKKVGKNHDINENISSQSRVFNGKAVLATHPKLGENAIVKMLEHLLQLPDGIVVLEMDGGTSAHTVPASAFLEIDLVAGSSLAKKISVILQTLQKIESEFQQKPQPGFEPDVSTFNIGKVRTNEDGITFSGCCRILPIVDEAQIESWMQALKESCHSVGANFKITNNKKPFHSHEKTAFARVCQEVIANLHSQSDFKKTTTCTEANVLSHFGVECLVWGPGQGVANTHQPNENIKISDLDKAVRFYSDVIEKFCI